MPVTIFAPPRSAVQNHPVDILLQSSRAASSLLHYLLSGASLLTDTAIAVGESAGEEKVTERIMAVSCDPQLNLLYCNRGTDVRVLRSEISKKLVIDDGVNGAWLRLTQDSNDISWIMCGYPPGSTNQLIVSSLHTFYF